MVGRGSFEITNIDKKACCLFTVRVRSNAVLSTLYPVDDVLHSFFDLNHMRSIHFEQKRKEGMNHVWEETFFYYELGQASTQSYANGEKKWFEIPKDGVQDKLSTIYYMRCMNWKTRNFASTVLGNDKRNYEVRMTKLKTEVLHTDDFQPIPTFQVRPNMEYLSGFVKKGNMWIWVSNDDFKIPIRVEAKLPIGTVTASLVKVEGVKDWPYHLKH